MGKYIPAICHVKDSGRGHGTEFTGDDGIGAQPGGISPDVNLSDVHVGLIFPLVGERVGETQKRAESVHGIGVEGKAVGKNGVGNGKGVRCGSGVLGWQQTVGTGLDGHHDPRRDRIVAAGGQVSDDYYHVSLVIYSCSG